MTGEDSVAFGLGTFQAPDGPVFAGWVRGDRVVPLDAGAGDATTTADALADWDAALERGRRASLDGARPLDGLRVLPPIRPAHLYCAGANYRSHVEQILGDGVTADNAPSPEVRREGRARLEERIRTGTPYVFVKAGAGVCGSEATVELPAQSHQHDWEAELAAVIGRRAYRVPADRALDVVAGYTIANDLTMRDFVYRPDIPSLRSDFFAAKHGRRFFPFGPFIVPADDVGDPHALRIALRLNGETMQDESTGDMMFGVARLIEYVSAHVELVPGDVVLTGSPAGNGTHYGRFLAPGDVMEVSITRLGRQRTPCVAEAPSPGPAEEG